MVGASGAVYGVLGAFGAMFPDLKIRMIFPPVTMRARTLAIGMGILAFLLTFSMDADDRTAHLVHLAGFIAGFSYGHRIRRYADLGMDMPSVKIPGFADARAKARRSTFSVVEGSKSDDAPVTKEDVDAVLDKMNRGGFKSLTKREREILEKSSDLYY